MISYKIHIDKIYGEKCGIIRLSDNAFIPLSDDNSDYQAYLKWLEEGNLPYPSDFVEPLPTASVTPLPADESQA